MITANSTLEIFIPLILFLMLLATNVLRLKRFFAMSNFILGLYSLSMFSFTVNAIFFNKGYFYLYEALALITICTLILIKPLSDFEMKVNKNIILIELNNTKFTALSYFFICLGIYACIFYAQNLIQVFFYGIIKMRADKIHFYDSSLFSKLAVFGSFCFSISQFLFYYNIIKYGFTLLAKLLLFSSTSFIFYTLNVAGRDGIILWFSSLIALFCLFYPIISASVRKKCYYYMMLSAICALPIFIFISISRFGQNGNDKLLSSIFDYLGQQLFVLSYNMQKLETIDYKNSTQNLFALFYDIISLFDEKYIRKDRFEILLSAHNLGIRSNQFSFYIGNFYEGVKIYWSFFIILLCYLVYRTNLKIVSNYVSTSKLLVACSWYMIIIAGVFYFYYGQLIGNVFLIVPFLIRWFMIIKR